ncbi:hypothetical protein ElyMa_005559100 [Elysia marginata]|uniref:Uncharacterized protein n=1 Tax=Elysia marginata TaxID=1093978 RepID=A0AAV4F111_9GAST|nr:hypothetical protein ElyMa_005559100 [Elysia marginata]
MSSRPANSPRALQTLPTDQMHPQDLARRASSDEIRRQPEYQYLTSWAAPRKMNNMLGLARPQTAYTESQVTRTRPRASTIDSVSNNKTCMSERPGSMRFEKGILRLRSNTNRVSGHDPQHRRYSLGAVPNKIGAEAEVSVYTNIAHLFQTDAFSGGALQSSASNQELENYAGQRSHPKKKVIRFVDTFKEPLINRESSVGDSVVHKQKIDEVQNVDASTQDENKASWPVSTNEETTTSFNTNCKTIECKKTSQTIHKSSSLSTSPCARNCKVDEKIKSDENFEIKKKGFSKSSTISESMDKAGKSCSEEICEEFREFSTQPKEHLKSRQFIAKTAKKNHISYWEKPDTPRGKHRHEIHNVIERSISNYDADLEKSDKYLRAQSHSFTQTSQHMTNTKRGLSHLSMHYSQTNTAHNDRVIMSDLLKNGHTRNALIGDSVYAVERRLYNRRRDPLKSTTFYERFVQEARCRNNAPHPRKRKSRTVADRAKERQERITKKKEEIERGFPPRAWSLVEVGAEDIEHMLNTCRYLRVDIRKQPNVYGIVELSDEA